MGKKNVVACTCCKREFSKKALHRVAYRTSRGYMAMRPVCDDCDKRGERGES